MPREYPSTPVVAVEWSISGVKVEIGETVRKAPVGEAQGPSKPDDTLPANLAFVPIPIVDPSVPYPRLPTRILGRLRYTISKSGIFPQRVTEP